MIRKWWASYRLIITAIYRDEQLFLFSKHNNRSILRYTIIVIEITPIVTVMFLCPLFFKITLMHLSIFTRSKEAISTISWIEESGVIKKSIIKTRSRKCAVYKVNRTQKQSGIIGGNIFISDQLHHFNTLGNSMLVFPKIARSKPFHPAVRLHPVFNGAGSIRSIALPLPTVFAEYLPCHTERFKWDNIIFQAIWNCMLSSQGHFIVNIQHLCEVKIILVWEKIACFRFANQPFGTPYFQCFARRHSKHIFISVKKSLQPHIICQPFLAYFKKRVERIVIYQHFAMRIGNSGKKIPNAVFMLLFDQFSVPRHSSSRFGKIVEINVKQLTCGSNHAKFPTLIGANLQVDR